MVSSGLHRERAWWSWIHANPIDPLWPMGNCCGILMGSLSGGGSLLASWAFARDHFDSLHLEGHFNLSQNPHEFRKFSIQNLRRSRGIHVVCQGGMSLLNVEGHFGKGTFWLPISLDTVIHNFFQHFTLTFDLQPWPKIIPALILGSLPPCWKSRPKVKWFEIWPCWAKMKTNFDWYSLKTKVLVQIVLRVCTCCDKLFFYQKII